MVTNDIGYSTLLYIPLDTDKMIESFVSGSMFRSFMPGKHGDELVGYADRVNHFMFRIARMHITSLKNDFGNSGIKVFKLQFPDFSSVHRISPFTSEFLNIKLMSTFTYFFIRIETDPDFAMFNFGMFLQIDNG